MLKPEYQKIVDEITRPNYILNHKSGESVIYTVARTVAENFQELHEKPVKRLTDIQIIDCFPFSVSYSRELQIHFANKVIDAHIKLQQGAVEVPFDYTLWSKGGWQAIYVSTVGVHSYVYAIEAKIPGTYLMKRN